MKLHSEFRGAHAPSRAGDGALAIAKFSSQFALFAQHFGGGAEISTRGACAPQKESSMKSFTDLFIKRPVLALVVSFVILIAGLQAMKTINVRQYPRSDIAAITVNTVYVGADAELVSADLLRHRWNARSPLRTASITSNRKARRAVRSSRRD